MMELAGSGEGLWIILSGLQTYFIPSVILIQVFWRIWK